MQSNISEVTTENLVVFSVAYKYAVHLHLSTLSHIYLAPLGNDSPTILLVDCSDDWFDCSTEASDSCRTSRMPSGWLYVCCACLS